jgi:hypothetical protein
VGGKPEDRLTAKRDPTPPTRDDPTHPVTKVRAGNEGELSGFQLAEYASMKEEISRITRRGYEIRYGAIVIALGMLTFGLSMSGLTSVCVIVAPVFVLSVAHRIILEQTKALRRIAAYVRVFYEGATNGIFWERDLSALRRDRSRRKGRQMRASMTVGDILKGVPDEYDWLVAACMAVASAKASAIGQADQGEAFEAAALIVGAAVFWMARIFLGRFRASRALVAGGELEAQYVREWHKIRRNRAWRASWDRAIGDVAVASLEEPPGREDWPGSSV